MKQQPASLLSYFYSYSWRNLNEHQCPAGVKKLFPDCCASAVPKISVLSGLLPKTSMACSMASVANTVSREGLIISWLATAVDGTLYCQNSWFSGNPVIWWFMDWRLSSHTAGATGLTVYLYLAGFVQCLLTMRNFGVMSQKLRMQGLKDHIIWTQQLKHALFKTSSTHKELDTVKKHHSKRTVLVRDAVMKTHQKSDWYTQLKLQVIWPVDSRLRHHTSIQHAHMCP